MRPAGIVLSPTTKSNGTSARRPYEAWARDSAAEANIAMRISGIHRICFFILPTFLVEAKELNRTTTGSTGRWVMVRLLQHLGQVSLTPIWSLTCFHCY